MSFPSADAICRIANPLDWNEEKSRLMVAACREMALFHGQHSSDLAFLYRKQGFEPESLQTEKDLERLPFIGVTAMKYFLLTSLPHEEAVLKLTSSGTRGQKTQIWFDQASLDRVQKQLDVLWEQEGLVSSEPTNYVSFIYDPSQAKDLGIAFSVKNEQRFATPLASYFAIQKNAAGAWEFQRDATLSHLREFAREGRPVRILGIPSFIYELLAALENEGPIRLPENSYMLTGGGWKAAEDKKITRDAFRAMASRLLGIPERNMRDGYGMAEHSAPYIECAHHRFHVPAYNRILARDPVSGRVSPPGQTGVLEFITPFNAMMPNLALLSTDMGYIDEEACGCGRTAPTFTLVGRGGLVKHKGCAITAAEIVRRD